MRRDTPNLSVFSPNAVPVQDVFVSVAVVSVSGNISIDMLFVSNFKAPITLLLLIKILNFVKILVNFILLSSDFNFACTVSLSHNSSLIFREQHDDLLVQKI